MSEEFIFPFRALFALLSIGALAAVVMVFIWLFIDATITIHEAGVDRVVIQMSNSLANSNLTIATGVFNKTMLDYYHGTDMEPHRHCSYGYKVKIELLADSNWDRKEWEFGYDPDDALEKVERYFPVAVYNEEGSLVPAKMTLTLYETHISRISCIVEKAHLGRMHAVPTPTYKSYTIERQGESICITHGSDTDCRRMRVNATLMKFEKPEGGIIYADIEKGKQLREMIKAVPISTVGIEAIKQLGSDFTSFCADIDRDWIQTVPHGDRTIVLCLEGGEPTGPLYRKG